MFFYCNVGVLVKYIPIKLLFVVSLTEIITNVDEVDLIMFNSISKSNTKSNKNNLDVVQLAASVRMNCIQ